MLPTPGGMPPPQFRAPPVATFVQQQRLTEALDPWGGGGPAGANWWEWTKEKNVLTDFKQIKLASNVASQLLVDRVGDDAKKRLKETKVRVFDFSKDGDMLAMMEGIGFTVDPHKQQDGTFFLLNNRLKNNQVVIIYSLFTPQPREVFTNLYSFVAEGGRLIFINSAPYLIGVLFQRVIQPMPHSVTIAAGLKIDADNHLFSGYDNEEWLSLEPNRYPLFVANSEQVTTIAHIDGQIDEPLLVKFPIGIGRVHVFVSKMRTNQKDVTQLKQYLEKKNAKPATIAAWEGFLRVGYKEGTSFAMQMYPFMELISKLVLQEKEAQLTLLKQMISEGRAGPHLQTVPGIPPWARPNQNAQPPKPQQPQQQPQQTTENQQQQSTQQQPTQQVNEETQQNGEQQQQEENGDDSVKQD